VALETPFTRLVGCRIPIQLAVMGGGVTTPELASAVSAAGGLGMVSSAHPLPAVDQLAAVRANTDGAVGVGFFAFDIPGRGAEFDVVARAADVVDVFWGAPDAAVVARIQAADALAFWQVGSRDEAVAAVDAGCDAVVTQGFEAGGHVWGRTPLLELIASVADAVDVPVIAAGGIATAAALAAAFDAGASAARIGTRLLATAESGAHPDYIAALIAASGDDTVHTTAFGADWPDAPHRVLRRAVAAAEAYTGAVVGHAQFGDAAWDVAHWSAQPPTKFMSGDITAMAMYAGTGVGDVTDAPPVAEVLERLMQAVAQRGDQE
jgi:NAD(P)H-dependent flavin oxidoreductase YrpB (nitropropane dioxygenase family)